MPLKRCSKDGKQGWKWGDQGTCYVGPQAKKQALKQAAAIKEQENNSMIPITLNSETSGGFWRQHLNNREHLVTRMVPIVGDSVMNKKFYPDEVVSNTYVQLDSLPAPNGHPVINGVQTSAFHPCATNAHNVGAFIRNPTRDGKKVINELWVDVQVAEHTEDGKELIRRIENSEKIGVSTGLVAKVSEVNGAHDGQDYAQQVTDIDFDHVAILLNEKPAGKETYTINMEEGEKELIFCSLEGNQFGIKTIREQLGPLMPEYSYIEEVVAESGEGGFVVYEKYMDSSEGGQLFKQGFSVDDTEKVELDGAAVRVRKRVEFLDVESGDAPQNNRETEETMSDENKGASPDNNSERAAQAGVTVEAAIELLESKGFTINSKQEAEDLQYLIQNKDWLTDILEREEEELQAIRERIVSNSDMEEADLKGMSEKMLRRLASSFGHTVLKGGYGMPAVNADENGGDEKGSQLPSYLPKYDAAEGEGVVHNG